MWMTHNTSVINTCTPAQIRKQKYKKIPYDLRYIIPLIYQSNEDVHEKEFYCI